MNPPDLNLSAAAARHLTDIHSILLVVFVRRRMLRRFDGQGAYPFHPAGKPGASLCGVTKRLRSHAYRGAPKPLVNEGLQRVSYPGQQACVWAGRRQGPFLRIVKPACAGYPCLWGGQRFDPGGFYRASRGIGLVQALFLWLSSISRPPNAPSSGIAKATT
jgi:hypothetical protein